MSVLVRVFRAREEQIACYINPRQLGVQDQSSCHLTKPVGSQQERTHRQEVMKHSPRVMCGLLVLLLTALTEARHSSCRQPSNQELAQYLSGGSSLPESFYQFPQLRQTVRTYNTSSDGYRARLSTFYDEGTHVPVTWMFNYNSDRFPDTLVEAKCKPCERGNIICSPVYYYTKVMRKGSCNNNTGVYNYEQKFEQEEAWREGSNLTHTHARAQPLWNHSTVWEPITVGCASRGANNRLVASNGRAVPPNKK
ncbi:hypothetical protein C0Q70_08427 [Pomacea canaliculata]|uniref:Uncharacterized protein n=1 Tax=Pomacea canaliculata TaxID=400727 RepID=A0A2T7PHT3_POMCA|nr:hypothetical protein C0Q70_08427 [Pomacea canaliculata]